MCNVPPHLTWDLTISDFAQLLTGLASRRAAIEQENRR